MVESSEKNAAFEFSVDWVWDNGGNNDDGFVLKFDDSIKKSLFLLAERFILFGWSIPNSSQRVVGKTSFTYLRKKISS